jgi:hypothetical protein
VASCGSSVGGLIMATSMLPHTESEVRHGLRLLNDMRVRLQLALSDDPSDAAMVMDDELIGSLIDAEDYMRRSLNA